MDTEPERAVMASPTGGDFRFSDITAMMAGMRSVRNSTLAGVALAGLLVGLLASCSKTDDSGSSSGPEGTAGPPAAKNTAGPPDAKNPTNGGKVVFGMEGEPEGVDSTRYALAVSGHLVASAVFDPLATIDATGKAVPYLARSIEPSDGNTKWTITLPEGVKFHNDELLDAEIVKTNLEAYRVSLITRAAFQTVSAVDVTGPNTITVTLSEPWAAFPSVMTSQLGYVLPKVMLDDPEKAIAPIGTGPFVFDSHVKDQVWSFKRNPTYWRKDASGGVLPHLDAVDFKPVPDNAKRLSDFEAGDLDVMMTNSPTQVKSLKVSPFKLVDYSEGEEDFFVLNTTKPPFDNLTARKAVVYASDSEGWRTTVNQGVEKPANSPFAPGQLGYLEDNGYPKYDMAKAKELVAQYKAETGKDLEFKLISTNDQAKLADNQYFVDRYQQAGMKVEIESFPQINLIPKVAQGEYQMGGWRLFGFADPDTDVVWWRSGSVQPPPGISLNFPRFQDEQVDAAIRKATSSSNPEERNAAYQVINKRFAEMVPYIWQGRVNWVMAARPSVNGIYPAANGTIQTLGAKTWISELWVKR